MFHCHHCQAQEICDESNGKVTDELILADAHSNLKHSQHELQFEMLKNLIPNTKKQKEVFEAQCVVLNWGSFLNS